MTTGTALHSAAGAGDAGAYEALLKAGASSGIEDDQGRAAIDLAPKDLKPELEALETKYGQGSAILSPFASFLSLLAHLFWLTFDANRDRREEEGQKGEEEQAEEEACVGKGW